MKIESLKVPLPKSHTQHAKPNAAPAKPFAVAKAAPLPARPSAPFAKAGVRRVRESVAGEERRRSQRVLLRVRANIYLAVQGKTVSFEATTLSVNDHGALMCLKQTIPVDARLVLEHSATKETVECRVARTAREMPEGYHIPLEFDAPAPNFWRIAFPPADWRPPDDL
jgi:hypothetical protein